MRIRAVGLFAVMTGLVLTIALPVSASSGDLDPSFGTAGATALPMQHVFLGHSVAVQSDGKIIVVGSDSAYHLVVARLTADGQLDASYGTAGSVTPSAVGAPVGLVIDSHDRAVVLAVTVTSGDNDVLTLVRLRPDGSLDPSFGVGGVAQQRPPAGGPVLYPTALAEQVVGTQDRLVVGGSLVGATGFAAERFNDDGTLDVSFGQGGLSVAQLPVWSGAWAVAVQSDGRVVLSGYDSPDGGTDYHLALVRLTLDGELDPTFGVGGYVVDATRSSNSSGQPGKDVVIGPDGHVTTIADAFDTQRNDDDFAVMRYLPDGSPDPGFGTGGRVVANMGGFDYANGLTMQPDGRVIAVGTTDDATTFAHRVAIARFLATGQLDPSFGHEGRVVNGFAGYVSTYATAAVLQGSAVVTTVWPKLVARYGG